MNASENIRNEALKKLLQQALGEHESRPEAALDAKILAALLQKPTNKIRSQPWLKRSVLVGLLLCVTRLESTFIKPVWPDPTSTTLRSRINPTNGQSFPSKSASILRSTEPGASDKLASQTPQAQRPPIRAQPLTQKSPSYPLPTLTDQPLQYRLNTSPQKAAFVDSSTQQAIYSRKRVALVAPTSEERTPTFNQLTSNRQERRLRPNGRVKAGIEKKPIINRLNALQEQANIDDKAAEQVDQFVTVQREERRLALGSPQPKSVTRHSFDSVTRQIETLPGSSMGISVTPLKRLMGRGISPGTNGPMARLMNRINTSVVSPPLPERQPTTLDQGKRLGWVINFVPLTTVQRVVILPKANARIQNVRFASGLIQSVGFKASLGLEKKGIQWGINYTQLNMSSSYEYSTDQYVVEENKGSDYSIKRVGTPLTTHLSIKLVGLAVKKQIDLTSPLLGRLFAALGMEYAHDFGHSPQHFLFVNATVGKRVALQGSTSLWIGPYIDYSLTRLQATDQLQIRPYQAGLSVVLKHRHSPNLKTN